MPSDGKSMYFFHHSVYWVLDSKETILKTEEEKSYCVYVHTNKINGKKYVGQTCKRPEIRWLSDGSGYKNQPYFYNAIKKYGWDNFDHEIIKNNMTSNEANQLEIELIAKLDTLNPECGYNLAEGGKSGRMSDVSKRRLSIAKTGTHHSEETKNKIRVSSIGKHRGLKNSMAKSVVQYTKSGEFIKIWDYIAQAEANLGVHSSSITHCCQGKYKTAGGYIWRYYDDIKDNKNIITF